MLRIWADRGRKPVIGAALALAVAASWTTARADTVWLESRGAGMSDTQVSNVRILRIEGPNIYYELNGHEVSKPVDRVSQLAVEGYPAFTAAEEAYAKKQWDVAVDGYQKTVRSAEKPWLREWARVRLIDASRQAGRFDAAVTAYIALVMKDPAMAAKSKPAMPDAKSTYLDTAVTDLNKALADTKLTDEQRQALLNLLLDVHRARGDADAAGKVAEQLTKLSPSAASADPGATRSVAQLKLNLAHLALDQKDYQKASSEIQGSRALFTGPSLQADALFVLAQAQEGIASTRNDPEVWKDAAIAYMRVVAHFKDAPAKPHVAESLLKTAAIHEKLNDPEMALQLYQAVASDFKDQPAAETAKQAIERLKSKG